MQELKVSQLFIYPIKSMGGISLQSSNVLAKGLAYDRRWMLVDANNRFLTQREHAILSLFKLAFNSNLSLLEVSFLGDRLSIPLEPAGTMEKADVWGDEVTVVEVSKQVSLWFAERLHMPCKLVFFPEQEPRLIEEGYHIGASDQTSLSDGYPILMLSEASLDDLNARLSQPVPMNRFRPNLVFAGGTPFQEDTITRFSINGVLFAGVKPCARCNMTTIDQESGKGGKEPLLTLSGYRKHSNKVLFGQNVIPLDTGTISIGDELRLLKTEIPVLGV